MSDYTVGWRGARKGKEHFEFVKIYLSKEHNDPVPREPRNLCFNSSIITIIADKEMFLTQTCHNVRNTMAQFVNFTNANSPRALAEINRQDET
jgi:hypothetical protein